MVLLLSLGMNGAGAAGCRSKPNEKKENVNQSNDNKPTPTPTPINAGEATGDELKVLAGGAYGKINDAFVVVARDVETYTALRSLVDNLPPLDADFFGKNLVIGAFLGERRTGGYGVQITRAANNHVRVSAASPPAGSMTTQALTAPFKIVSVSIDENRPPTIEVDAEWKKEMRPYRVASGEFTTGGGFAGRIEKLQLSGDILIARLGKLVTFAFDLKSAGGTKSRVLQDAATGVIEAGGEIGGAVVDAGTLVDIPRSPLSVKGKFTQQEDHLALSFESLPSNVADGYSGQGRLEATATAPPPPKKQASDDAPM
jgi:hypothetical protein